jgi:predicted PurR-regulated permease PerM
MILKSHLISMIIYAVFVCVVLAIIRRRERKAQIRYFVSLFLIMVVGALLFGWFMYLFIP